MKKKKLLLPFLFFFCALAAANRPPAVPLPAYPEMAREILSRKEMMQEHTKISPIEWSMNWHTGIQQIRLTHPSSILGVNTELAEIIYTTNQYRGAVISVDVRPLFTIYSNLSVGFLKGQFPRNFSVDSLPYRSNEWVSLESDSYVAKKFFIQKDITAAPYAGYTFSQYQLTPTSQLLAKEERMLHSILAGIKFIFQPHRIFFIETSLSFTPLTMVDRRPLSMFQINYETLFTFSTKHLTLSLILSSRNNIQYESIQPEEINLQISKTGFRFRFSL